MDRFSKFWILILSLIKQWKNLALQIHNLSAVIKIIKNFAINLIDFSMNYNYPYIKYKF